MQMGSRATGALVKGDSRSVGRVDLSACSYEVEITTIQGVTLLAIEGRIRILLYHSLQPVLMVVSIFKDLSSLSRP